MRLCVFCGCQPGRLAAYGDAAQRFGMVLAQRGVGLVYGGGRVGMMGVLADSVLANGGEVIGVIPQALVARELAHGGITDLRVVASMHERKALMAALADAFVALPGGFGTFEEFCEATTWTQLGLHQKPCGLLNVEGFFDPLLRLFDHAASEGFILPEHRAIVVVDDDAQRLLDRLAAYCPPPQEKWIDLDET
ncbi:MAG: TIGR00730 family Rossman fold protein [Pirellulales bacterium]